MSDERPEELHDYTLEAIVKALKAIQVMVEAAEGNGWYIKGPLGFWHADGWSPGYFSLQEDWVTFVPKYEEN
jgi:hypothetical protein